MTSPLVIELPGIPRGKQRPRFSRRSGTTYTPAQTATHELNLAYAAKIAMDGRKPLSGPLYVTVEAIMPIPQSWSKKKKAAAISGDVQPTVTPDADNLLKCTDALNQIVWIDDKQIVDCRVSKRYGERPMLRISVWPMDQHAPATAESLPMFKEVA